MMAGGVCAYPAWELFKFACFVGWISVSAIHRLLRIT